MISGKSKKISQLFDKILEADSDIKGMILLSNEGLVMVSTFKTGIKEEAVAAMTAGLSASVTRFLKGMEWNDLSNIILTCSKEYILIKNIDGVGLLATLTKSNVNWETICSHINYAVSIIDFLIKPLWAESP